MATAKQTTPYDAKKLLVNCHERRQSKAHGGETKSSGTILNSRRLAPKGASPKDGTSNPQCTCEYMRISSRRATQLCQAQ
jgi:hypothetical protein